MSSNKYNNFFKDNENKNQIEEYIGRTKEKEEFENSYDEKINVIKYWGYPGIGKTSLNEILMQKMNVRFLVSSHKKFLLFLQPLF